MAPLVRTGGSRHTGLAALPHRNIHKAKLINFEDDGEGILKADLVFNALYRDGDLPQVKAGEKYYISGKTFMFYKPIQIKENVKRVFISFGGADPQNYSDRILKIVSEKNIEDINLQLF